MINSIENGISIAADIAGYIPVVCFFSGLTRAVYGVAKEIFYSIKVNFSEDEILIAKYQKEADKGWEHIKEGGLGALHIKIAVIFLKCCIVVLSYCLIIACMNDLNKKKDENGVFHLHHEINWRDVKWERVH
jgi:hypothetical protein